MRIHACGGTRRRAAERGVRERVDVMLRAIAHRNDVTHRDQQEPATRNNQTLSHGSSIQFPSLVLEVPSRIKIFDTDGPL